MSASKADRGSPVKAHVTVDAGMGPLYDWFVSFDPRYRARELVCLARLGLEEMERQRVAAARARPSADQAPAAQTAQPPAPASAPEPRWLEETG